MRFSGSPGSPAPVDIFVGKVEYLKKGLMK